MSSLATNVGRAADRLAHMFTGRGSATPEQTLPPQRQGESDLAGFGLDSQGAVAAYFAAIDRPGARAEEMRYYDGLESEIPEVGKALSAFATMATTGTLTGQTRGTFQIRMAEGTPSSVVEWNKIAWEVIRKHAFSIVYGMAKYGSYPAEGMIDQIDGRLAMVDLNHIPPAVMARNIVNGRSDDAKYWRVDPSAPGVPMPVNPGQNDGQLYLPRWRVPHFAVWTNLVTADKRVIYGTSMLRPIGRIALQVQSMQDAMVIRRLTRAAMKYVTKIDISDIRNDQPKIRDRLQRWKTALSRARAITRGGRSDSRQRAAVPDEDFYIPAGKGLEYGIDTLEGDGGLGEVADIEMLVRFFFGALGVPPEYLGHERSQGGRSVLSQIDINFARSSRHLQMFAAAAFQDMVRAHMILGGYNPDLYPVDIVPPTIGARDDLLQAQVRALQATVLGTLQTAGMDLTKDPRWVMRTFLNMDEELETLPPEVLDRLFKDPDPVVAPAKKPANRTANEWAGDLAVQTRQALSNIRSILSFNDMSYDPIKSLYEHDHPSVRALRQSIWNQAA